MPQQRHVAGIFLCWVNCFKLDIHISITCTLNKQKILSSYPRNIALCVYNFANNKMHKTESSQWTQNWTQTKSFIDWQFVPVNLLALASGHKHMNVQLFSSNRIVNSINTESFLFQYATCMYLELASEMELNSSLVQSFTVVISSLSGLSLRLKSPPSKSAGETVTVANIQGLLEVLKASGSTWWHSIAETK